MKNNSKNIRNIKGQEEMVGFALIVIIVAVILIVFLSIYLKKPQEEVEDYETSSFLQAIMQYTTTCEEDNLENLTVQDLIPKCKEKTPCYYNQEINQESDPCVILNDTITKVIQGSWNIGPEYPIKGYSFITTISDSRTQEQMLNITGGVVTRNYRGSEQDFGKSKGTWRSIVILFNVYS